MSQSHNTSTASMDNQGQGFSTPPRNRPSGKFESTPPRTDKFSNYSSECVNLMLQAPAKRQSKGPKNIRDGSGARHVRDSRDSILDNSFEAGAASSDHSRYGEPSQQFRPEYGVSLRVKKLPGVIREYSPKQISDSI